MGQGRFLSSQAKPGKGVVSPIPVCQVSPLANSTLIGQGGPDGAADDLRRAVELWDKDSAPPIEMRFERARALALLARLGAGPHSGVRAAEAKAFADRAVAALAGAVRAGSCEAAELKGPDFDAVRERDDFRKLAAALAKDAAHGSELLWAPREE
jgi:hypothetical protein